MNFFKKLIVISNLLLLLGCSDNENFDYPIVHTGEIVIQNGTITFNGAVYNKDHLNPGTLEYGFYTQKISEYERKSIKAQSLSGKYNFSTTLPLDSVPGDGYVKA